jgi:hypothetical protein
MSSAMTVKGSRCAAYPMQWIRLIMTCCGMAVKRMGMLGVSIKKLKALTVKMEIAALIAKCR